MGAVMDEETGEEPVCLFCGAAGDCPHLVAVIDRTFAECKGGVLYDAIDNLREMLSSKILETLKSGKRFQPESSDEEIYVIANEAGEDYIPDYPEDVYIDENMFLTWITQQLIDCGADEHPGYIVEEGGPGQSAALTLLYAMEPKKVIQCVEKALSDAVANL